MSQNDLFYKPGFQRIRTFILLKKGLEKNFFERDLKYIFSSYKNTDLFNDFSAVSNSRVKSYIDRAIAINARHKYETIVYTNNISKRSHNKRFY